MNQPRAFKDGSLGTLGGSDATLTTIGPASNMAAFADGSLGNTHSSISTIAPVSNSAAYRDGSLGRTGCSSCGGLGSPDGLGALSDVNTFTLIGVSISALIGAWLVPKFYKGKNARTLGAAVFGGVALANTILSSKKEPAAPAPAPAAGIGEYFSSGF